MLQSFIGCIAKPKVFEIRQSLEVLNASPFDGVLLKVECPDLEAHKGFQPLVRDLRTADFQFSGGGPVQVAQRRVC